MRLMKYPFRSYLPHINGQTTSNTFRYNNTATLAVLG